MEQEQAVSAHRLLSGSHVVMAGLVPAIYFRRRDCPEGDARNKSGHDGERVGTPVAPEPG